MFLASLISLIIEPKLITHNVHFTIQSFSSYSTLELNYNFLQREKNTFIEFFKNMSFLWILGIQNLKKNNHLVHMDMTIWRRRSTCNEIKYIQIVIGDKQQELKHGDVM